jgi:hypothetical protein
MLVIEKAFVSLKVNEDVEASLTETGRSAANRNKATQVFKRLIDTPMVGVSSY